ncbi:MAG: hypothetical protein A2W31_12785, partial [Planctomycetes bacterium RBG_16_64_10]
HYHGHYRPLWAVYERGFGFGTWYGYPRWGLHVAGWPLFGYYAPWWDPVVYYNAIYYNPTVYLPLCYGPLAYNPVAYVTAYATLPVDPAVAVDEPPPEEIAPPEPSGAAIRAGDQFVAQAEAAFRAGRYEHAVTDIQHALVELPNDGHLSLLLSQALFAVGDFQGAITAAYRGMALLDTNQWGSIVENYAQYYGNDDYVAQMRRLDRYIDENPKAAYAYALRGYHFGYLGHEKQARADLGKAIELEPRDQFAATLLEQFGGPEHRPTPPPGPADSDQATPKTEGIAP